MNPADVNPHTPRRSTLQFDGLADLTAFGIAPGLLVYFYTQTLDPVWFAAHAR